MDYPDMEGTSHPWIIGFAHQELLKANLTWHEHQQVLAEIWKTIIDPFHYIRRVSVMTGYTVMDKCCN